MKPRLIIVDDIFGQRQKLVQGLGEAFDVVAEAESGHEAVEKIRVLHPQLALIDLVMPKMGAFEVLEVFMQEATEVQFVVRTGVSHSRDILRAFEYGAREVVPNSMPIPLLSQVLERVCKKSESQWLHYKRTPK